MSAPTKDLCIINFDEKANLPEVKRRVLNAFLEGYYCFQFRLTFGKRQFEDRVALPADADEACALEMAEYQFSRFLATISGLVTKRL
jgi:hypothetical protein